MQIEEVLLHAMRQYNVDIESNGLFLIIYNFIYGSQMKYNYTIIKMNIGYRKNYYKL